MSTRQAILPILKPGETFRRSRAEQAVMCVAGYRVSVRFKCNLSMPAGRQMVSSSVRVVGKLGERWVLIPPQTGRMRGGCTSRADPLLSVFP